MNLTPILLLAPDSVVEAAAQKPTEKETVTKYISAAQAVKEIMKKNPQVIVFGEIHPDPGFKYISTKARFSSQVLPVLKANKMQVLVLEWIPTDSKIEEELNQFNLGKIEINDIQTPLLWQNIAYSDRNDFVRLLHAARKTGIRIEAGGMTLSQAQETTKNPNFEKDIELKKKAAIYTGKAMLGKILLLLKANPKLKLAAFGGIDHNNIYDTEERLTNGIAFGQQLAKKLGKGYFEVDLIAPEEGPIIDIALGVKNWKRYIPHSGVVSLKRNNSEIIFFPYTKITLKDRHEKF